MKQLFQSDLTKTLLYLALTLVASAALAPWPYNFGKMIAEIAESRTTSAATQGIAGWCAKAEFAHFFLLSFLACALVFAGPFICWVRLGSGANTAPVRPWSLNLPSDGLPKTGQPLSKNPRRLLHWLTGFLLAGSLLALMNWLFLLTEWLAFDHPVDWLPAVVRALTASVILAIVLEWVFRGALLGILLRSLRPAIAICGVSLLYACLYFVLPEQKFQIDKVDELDAGFRYLEGIVSHLSMDLGDILGFMTLFSAGLILAYCRYCTASLSLSIGLQTGWLFVFLFSHETIRLASTHTAIVDTIIGSDRLSGMIPLCVLIATGLLTHVFVDTSTRNNSTT